MKKTIVATLLLLAVVAFAEDEQLISDKIESGGFGGPVWKLTQLNGKTAYLTGGRGGWIINHTFILGGGGYNTESDVKTGLTGQGGKPLYLGMEYGGVEIEFLHHSQKLVHWTVRSLFGGGHVRLSERDPSRETVSDGFGIVDADLNVELNVLKWMRVNAGAGYRLVYGIEANGLSNSDVGGGFGQVTLKFGKF
jgi:hypothetical protein